MTARMRSLGQPAGALIIGLCAAALVILLTGGQPLAAFAAMAHGAFGDVPKSVSDSLAQKQVLVPNEMLRTLARATPLILSGLGVAIALRAGMFNIGAEGQIFVGGLAAAYIGFRISGLPVLVHLPLALLAGILAGAAWGLAPGILKAWRGTHEVIVTIMMNYLAFELTRYLVNGPLHDPKTRMTATPLVLPSAQLWRIHGPSNFSAGFFLALVCAIGAAYFIRRTSLGFEFRAVGLGPDAARSAGISVGKTQALAMAISGGLAGLAGAVEVLAVQHRFLDSFSPGYGFDSIAVALLGGLSSIGITISALLFGALNSGALVMELDAGIPRQIAGIIQAIVILVVGASYLRSRKR